MAQERKGSFNVPGFEAGVSFSGETNLVFCRRPLSPVRGFGGIQVETTLRYDSEDKMKLVEVERTN